MKIGWVRDYKLSERPGGTQVCESLLRAGVETAGGVELIECPPGSVQTDVDAYIALNCQTYTLDEMRQITSKPLLHYSLDYWDSGNFEQRALIFSKARKVFFCSPLHKSVYIRRWGIGHRGEIITPPMDVEHWLSLREKSNGRSGIMWCGTSDTSKGLDIAVLWAKEHDAQLDIYGIGLSPGQVSPDEKIHVRGYVEDNEHDLALATHEKFVFFPRGPEPFCYSLLEAWLAGLEVIYSGRIGFESFDKPWDEITEDCYKSPQRFWEIAESCL